jgi:hypothetical protein
MSSKDPRPIYSGTFTAGTQQFAGRDMTINAPTTGQIGTVNQQLANLSEVEALVSELRLTAEERDATNAAIEELRTELAKPKPDAPRAASALESLTSILQAAGGLAGAGVALITPLGQIATALGSAAAGVLRMLGKG